MTDRELENKVHQAFERATPNVLDAVLSQCDQQKGNVIPMTKHNGKKRSWTRVASLAAAFALVLGLGFGYYGYQQATAEACVISLDVNPSLDIRLSKNETVLSVEARNEDGKKIIGNMDFKGSSLEVTINALIGSMVRNGYLSDIANSILVSVEGADPAEAASVQKRITDTVRSLLTTDSFSGAVLSQVVDDDTGLKELAVEYNISIGKAALIKRINAQNNRYSIDDLAQLSINELNLLSESGGHHLDGITASGSASEKGYIGSEAALTAAMEHAQVSQQDMTGLQICLDFENGVMVYEVEFLAGGFEYEYDIDAMSGAVVYSEKEIEDEFPSTAGSAAITPDEAKAAAFAHAGIAENTAKFVKCVLERDDGDLIYEVSFCSGLAEYEYDINAQSGKIISFDKDVCDDRHQLLTENPGGIGLDVQLIGAEAARKVALAHAQVSATQLRNYKCQLEEDDGVIHYEISFMVGSTEYEYDVHAYTGMILSSEIVLDD